MDYRITPHFQNIPLIVVEICLIALTSLVFFRAYLKSGNKSALCMFFGGCSMVAGYLTALLAYLYFPDNLYLLSWYTNIIAEIFFFMGWTYFTIAGIFIYQGKLNILYALIVLIFGFISVFAATIFFKPYELSVTKIMNFNRNFLIDFTQYLIAVTLVMVYGNAFKKGFSQVKNKGGVIIAIIGTATTFIGSNIVTLSPDPAFAVMMQWVVIFGIICILIGINWLGKSVENSN